ncbi:hypothetical protein VTI74DRAFT_10196 [Chaetomium olivicolor]
MSLVSEAFTLSGDPTSRHIYFQKLSGYPRVFRPWSSSPKLLMMELPSNTHDDNAVTTPQSQFSSVASPDTPEFSKGFDLTTTPDTLSTGSKYESGSLSISDPLPERPLVPTSAADWELRKPIIRKLYMDQNMILNEVIEIMLSRYKFKATARMYKGQFAKWKWTKYNKSGNHGHPQLGGEMLRRAFLGIERAVDCGLDIEALWDCCLAVPQLVLTMGWTDLLYIFARYLHQYTSIKLPRHPITRVAESLHRLSRQINTTPFGWSKWQLETFVSHGWNLWIDCVTRVRGCRDDVTIHMKRGYVTLINPYHRMAQDFIHDFGQGVKDSIRRRGALATTNRILELEHLLVRMFLPLFTAETAKRAELMLGAVAAKIEGKPANRGVPVTDWDYQDRYFVFSAYHFLASIADHNGDMEKAAFYRHKCLDSPRDLFWLQTSMLLESRLRAEGMDEEANGIQQARFEVQSRLGVSELQLTGKLDVGNARLLQDIEQERVIDGLAGLAEE